MISDPLINESFLVAAGKLRLRAPNVAPLLKRAETPHPDRVRGRTIAIADRTFAETIPGGSKKVIRRLASGGTSTKAARVRGW